MKISIITATYNAAHTVRDTLESVRRQTHPHIEHWVIDGGSKDGTQAIVQAHADRLAGFVSEPDAGVYDALNKGLRLATGEVVGFLHADDVYAEDDVLAKVAAAFEDRTVEACYGDLVYVDKDDLSRVIRYWKAGRFDPAKLARGWMPPHPTFYARRSVYARLGLFDTGYRISADYESMVRFLFQARIRVTYIPEILVCMRVGGMSNQSLKTIARKSVEDYRIMRVHGVGGFRTLLQKNITKIGQFWQRIPE